MTEDDIYPFLAPLASGNVYPYVAPLGDDGQPSISPPWVIFSIISDVSADVLCGQAESGISVQVDVYALTISEAREIRDMALHAVKPLNPTNVTKTPGYEPDKRYYRSSLEFQITV
ncbi:MULTISPECIES: tail completion protein gp17 [Citrobacter]|uniref:tail completion protein gp17 n=1 Tax=Citrobacter TaxID=544 RepID=UPI0004DA868B|nr:MULTISPECIES: DUF3168 domain-containing protein [Citrobacter]HAU5703017.1 DUF3168 domain-containing protein [Citrobacter freundii]KEY45291.1 hypothetical protein DQ02_21665 [Citrobacter amalonaticus]QMD63056.1 DUF3168 domain-containing protein [Citrobacter sp. RHB35-C17]RSB19741.1 DUF3168 domain-containing protein [Citrobacter farmeri]GJK86860.1 hypothetical protein TUM17567_31550 [Citrobacter amalonaticus]